MDSSTPPRSPRKTYKQGYPDNPFEVKVTLIDGIILAVTLAFVAVAVVDGIRSSAGSPYVAIRTVHFQLSRYGLAAAAAMSIFALGVGVVLKDDVTPWFRRGAYVVFGSMLIQAVLGFVLLLVFSVQPYQPEHIVYGIATVACLPFFIFVETTAKKRPAMGSYVWAFVLLIGIIVRAIGTGKGV